jgi:PAS domain S-box-containing protein
MLTSSKLFTQTQNQLDHSRLLALINSLSEGFLALDENGVIELSNSVALSLLDTNALESKNVSEAMPVIDSEGSPVKLMDLARTRQPGFISRDLKLRYKDGSIINLYTNISTVRGAFGGAGKGGYVLLFRDITAEKTAEEERDEFISVASHELRTPVAIAEGSLSNAMLMAGRTEARDNVQQVLKSAHDQIIFLSGLINDLAMVSRADHEKFVHAAADFNPNEVIASLQNDYSAQAAKKKLVVNVESQQLPVIYGSRLYTHEILQNFITNSLKYTTQGGITLRGEVIGDGVDLSVSDTGFGIDSQEQARLFTKFFRSEDSRVREISGTGLGLYVCAKLAHLMGGSISMKSELNKGSVFTLHLPLNFSNRKPVA